MKGNGRTESTENFLAAAESIEDQLKTRGDIIKITRKILVIFFIRLPPVVYYKSLQVEISVCSYKNID